MLPFISNNDTICHDPVIRMYGNGHLPHYHNFIKSPIIIYYNFLRQHDVTPIQHKLNILQHLLIVVCLKANYMTCLLQSYTGSLKATGTLPKIHQVQMCGPSSCNGPSAVWGRQSLSLCSAPVNTSTISLAVSALH